MTQGLSRAGKLRAARLLGGSQPRISDLMRGKINLFSIDDLVNLLAAAGLRVDLKVKLQLASCDKISKIEEAPAPAL